MTMHIQHISLTDLKICPLNVRKHGDKTGEDLKSSIKRKGVLQSLLVRKNCQPTSGGAYEIISGQRRFNACQSLVHEGETINELPCIIMESDDDAAAIEASLAENIERLPMDEIDQYQAFSNLIEQGRTVEEIALEFGITERLVNQRLAIGNLHSPILNAYRRDEIDPKSLRYLTLASKAKQKAWWKLFKDEEQYTPTGRNLKAWLFEGGAISTANALFDLEQFEGAIVSNLFGDDNYFADNEQFWTAQNNVIVQRIKQYEAEGWQHVHLLEVGTNWMSWNHVSTDKQDGGEIYIELSHDGEVSFHVGYIHQDEYRHRQKTEAAEHETVKAPRPEITKAMQNYLALHRYNATRVALLNKPEVAMCLMVAHVIAGSDLWQIKPDPQKAANEPIANSIEQSISQHKMLAERAEIARLLEIGDDDHIVDQPIGYWGEGRNFMEIFTRLLTLSDSDVMRILTYIMAETLQSDCAIVEALGQQFGVNMGEVWQPEDTFFNLLRDKQAINAMVSEIAGEDTAKANITATAKVQKNIIQDCLDGTRKSQVKFWQPRYMQFPMQAYTERGGIAAVEQGAAIAKLMSD